MKTDEVAYVLEESYFEVYHRCNLTQLE